MNLKTKCFQSILNFFRISSFLVLSIISALFSLALLVLPIYIMIKQAYDKKKYFSVYPHKYEKYIHLYEPCKLTNNYKQLKWIVPNLTLLNKGTFRLRVCILTSTTLTLTLSTFRCWVFLTENIDSNQYQCRCKSLLQTYWVLDAWTHKIRLAYN